MTAVLNQVGQQQLTVTGLPVGITRPPVTTGELRNEFGQLNRMTVARMLAIVHDQPVRWNASGQNPTGGVEDQLLNPGERLDWTDPRIDYRGPIDLIKFVLDTTATGNAIVEIAMFA